jgi:hypothetical protein
MIEHYHHGSPVCAAKARLALAEKAIAWLARCKARPSFPSLLLTWCPPDLTDDLKTFGRQSWPQVERILGAALPHSGA